MLTLSADGLGVALEHVEKTLVLGAVVGSEPGEDCITAVLEDVLSTWAAHPPALARAVASCVEGGEVSCLKMHGKGHA